MNSRIRGIRVGRVISQDFGRSGEKNSQRSIFEGGVKSMNNGGIFVIITRTNGGYRIGFGYALTRMRIFEYANAVNSRANIVVGK